MTVSGGDVWQQAHAEKSPAAVPREDSNSGALRLHNILTQEFRHRSLRRS